MKTYKTFTSHASRRGDLISVRVRAADAALEQLALAVQYGTCCSWAGRVEASAASVGHEVGLTAVLHQLLMSFFAPSREKAIGATQQHVNSYRPSHLAAATGLHSWAHAHASRSHHPAHCTAALTAQSAVHTHNFLAPQLGSQHSLATCLAACCGLALCALHACRPRAASQRARACARA